MKNYIFSLICLACVFELVCEFAPFSQNSAVKKYVKYILSLVLALAIVAPVAGYAGKEIGTENILKNNGGETAAQAFGYILFDSDTLTVYSCDAEGQSDLEEKVITTVYIKKCGFNIIDNSITALCDKFNLEKDKIKLRIAFDATDTSDIKIICAYVKVNSMGKYIQSDAENYLKDLLSCRVEGIK